MYKQPMQGFTLIELSIVLVIIGLIIGGILTGQDLINAAAERAQIAQIEKYNTAVRTFQGKYGFLPGDIPNPQATQFGFAARGSNAGEGDGNGILQGVLYDGVGTNYGGLEATGENAMFWVDLGKAGLIDGTFNTALSNLSPAANITSAGVGNYLPAAKISNGNFVSVSSGGYTSLDSTNFYTISNVTQIANYGILSSSPGLSVKQAYDIDKKVDDGLPQSGGVMALNNNIYNGATLFLTINGKNYTALIWASAPTYSGNCVISGMGDCTAATNSPTTAATAGSSLTCYDNRGAGGAEQYSTQQNGGGATNCALSFRFQ